VPAVIAAATGSDWNAGGSLLTFYFPVGLFVVVAAILYLLFSRPHRRVPARRGLATAYAGGATPAAPQRVRTASAGGAPAAEASTAAGGAGGAGDAPADPTAAVPGQDVPGDARGGDVGLRPEGSVTGEGTEDSK
jgi:hypothetical protein